MVFFDLGHKKRLLLLGQPVLYKFAHGFLNFGFIDTVIRFCRVNQGLDDDFGSQIVCHAGTARLRHRQLHHCTKHVDKTSHVSLLSLCVMISQGTISGLTVISRDSGQTRFYNIMHCMIWKSQNTKLNFLVR